MNTAHHTVSFAPRHSQDLETRSLEDCHAGNGVRSLPADPAFWQPEDVGSSAPLPLDSDRVVCFCRNVGDAIRFTLPGGASLTVARQNVPQSVLDSIAKSRAAGWAMSATFTHQELVELAHAPSAA